MKRLEHRLTTQTMNMFSVPTMVAEQPCDNTAPEHFDIVTGRYEFLNALLTAPANNKIFVVEGGKRKYRQTRYDCDTQEYEVVLGKTIWTELPEEIGTACCHTKPDVNGCLTTAKPLRLCLKDCYDDITEHFRRMQRQGFSLFGGTDAEKEYMAELKAWFVFFQARDIMYGQHDVVGNNIARFHGVLEMMNKAVVSISATDIIGAFEQLGCRFDLLSGNYAMGAHPMTINSIIQAVTRRGTSSPYNGFTVNGNSISYKGYPILPDINIPIDMEVGTGQIWGVDLNQAGVYMEYALSNPDVDIKSTYTDSDTGDCFNECVFLKNYGFAYTRDYNRVFRVTDIPLNGACLADKTLLGLGSLIQPETLIPTYS